MSGLAVVICAPVGRDRIFTYRALVELADQLASAGISVIRFDNKGYGDSLDLARSDDQWSHWLSGVRSAYHFARTTLDSAKVVLLGLRIGATLARTSMADILPDGFVLLDPIVTGEEWLRELGRARAMMHRTDQFEDGIEVHGLWISNAAVRSVKSVDLTVGGQPWPETLIMGPSVPKELIGSVGDLAEIATFAGYGALFKDAHLSVTPVMAFKYVEDWLLRKFPGFGSAAPMIGLPDRLECDGWTERHIDVGGGQRGVLCVPAVEHFDGQAVLFINTAANPRSGDGNFMTKASRSVAASGTASLRIDLLGIGDSDAHVDGRVHVYDTCRKGELAHVHRALRELGYSDIMVIGICTGGYHALQAVCEGSLTFRNALIINTWITWKKGTPLDRSAHAASMRAIYMRAPVKVRKALIVRHKFWSAAKVLGERFRSRFFPEPEVRSAFVRIANAAQRGVKLRFLMGKHDRAWESLSKFGFRGARLKKITGVSVKTLEDLDHSVISIKSQDVVIKEIHEFLGMPPQRSMCS